MAVATNRVPVTFAAPHRGSSRRSFCDNCHKSPSVLHLLEQSALQRHAEMDAAESVFLGTAQVTTTHILAVDDDPSVRQMIADYLGDNEIRVTALASGKQIPEVMARDTIDLD